MMYCSSLCKNFGDRFTFKSVILYNDYFILKILYERRNNQDKTVLQWQKVKRYGFNRFLVNISAAKWCSGIPIQGIYSPLSKL